MNSTELLDEYERHTSFQYTSSLDGTDDVWVSAELRNNTIELSIEATKSCKMEITFTIEGKTFVIPVKVKVVELSSYGCLLEKDISKTQSERVFGKIVWKSFDSKIASVSKNGVVKGKKIGNVLISAKLGDQYVGCVVSVTTAQIKKFVPEPVIWEKTGNTVRQSADKRDIMIAVRWCGKLISPIQKSILEVQLIREPQKRNLHGAEIMENC